MRYHLIFFCLVLWIPLDMFWVSADAYTEQKSLERDVVGEKVNIAGFGRQLSEDNFVGWQWDHPRDIYEVRILGVDKDTAESLRLEWWGSVWPANGTGGWMRLDDPWNGKWVHTNTKPELSKSGQFVFKFPPLSKEEWHQALKPDQYLDKKPPVFRRTLKVRLVTKGKNILDQSRLLVFGNSRWSKATFDIKTRLSVGNDISGRIELINGVLVNIERLPSSKSVQVDGAVWKAKSVAESLTGVRVKILYVDDEDINSNSLTRVTVRLGLHPRALGFSFVPQDVLRVGTIHIPAFNTIVSEASGSIDTGPSGDKWRSPVRGRILERPEMTREMALQGIPRLSPPRWIPLGVPSARQEFLIGPKGDWKISALSLNTDTGQDAKRWIFKKDFGKERQWDEFVTFLDTRCESKFDGGDREGIRRYLEEGYLPLVNVEWKNGTFRYHHALATTILLGDYGDDVSRRGDETVVLLSRLQVTNTADTEQMASLSLKYSINVPIILQRDGLIIVKSVDSNDLAALRGVISMDRPAGGGVGNWKVKAGEGTESLVILYWQEKLKPGETRSVYFKTPFVELLDVEELNRLKEISFEQEVRVVLDYWRKRIGKGMQIEVPDEAINNFYKANLWHNVITTDRDPQTGLYNQGVATLRYRVFANETVMIARSMDMRGEHLEAERFLEPMLRYQGREPLKGRFSTKDGVFHSAGDYTHGEYAMNHGFTLWGVADHYLLTRDRAYMERVAPKLVKGCDFLVKERASTKDKPDSEIYGLSPASSLEDVVEYQYWFATNAYFYLGMKRAAQALADIDHPEARRIATEAEKYRRDIETSVREATTRAAVVPLRDGNYIPYVPSRVYQWRHLTEGWIREALYCSLHLAAAEIVPPDDPLMTWMLDDLEDNIFFSWQSGYNVSDYRQRWFERGGVTLQPCLLDMPIVYMARNEMAAALRAFWNTYALLIYPDTQCFAEWARRFGVGGGPVYKTSDESRFVMWLRQLLVWENGDRLWLARATPREWLQDGNTIRVERAQTIFGTVSMVIRSEINKGRIFSRIYLPERNPPTEVWLRLRHPQGKRPRRVSINGKLLEPERIVGSDIRIIPGIEDLLQPVECTVEY